MNIWELIQNNNFIGACEIADLQYNETKNILLLRNKIYALFHLRKFEGVIELSKKIIELRKGESDSDFINLGIAYWAILDYEKAINAWQEAHSSIYKDAAGGIDVQIYLYYASIRTENDLLKKDTIKGIKKLLKSKRATNWPGPLGSYLLSQIDYSCMMESVSEVPMLKERQLCQGNFVHAIKILEQGNLKVFYEILEFCINLGSSAYLEQSYYLAMIELFNNKK